MMKVCKYTGDDEQLQGETALVMPNGAGMVLIQADDVTTGYGYGWHEFPASDWDEDVGS
jgi:hypothetical protein